MEAPVRIEVERASLGLVWEGGERTNLPATTLRAACPCAGCREVSPEAAADVTIDSARVVGDYALGIVFGPDGHASGIFPYDLLRALGSEG